MIRRRTFLKTFACLPLAGACSQGVISTNRLRVTLAGQALMVHPPCADPYPGFEAIVRELRRGDIVFTDLEVAIRTPSSGSPTRFNDFLHQASPGVLPCLADMGFNLLALSNNHAWDLGTEGVLATRAAVIEAGFAAAGTGHNLAEATAPAFLLRRGQRVSLVSMATNKIPEGAAATENRAGVNELRLLDGVPLAEDELRILASIRRAKADSDLVIVYHHNHDWGDDMAVTRPWAKAFARRCADAGARVYVSHGAPLLHGIERYKDSMLMFGLGSLVFHSKTAPGYYPPQVWESAIVHLDFENGSLVDTEVIPVSLNEIGDDPQRQNETRGRPRIASGEAADRIRQTLAIVQGASE